MKRHLAAAVVVLLLGLVACGDSSEPKVKQSAVRGVEPPTSTVVPALPVPSKSSVSPRRSDQTAEPTFKSLPAPDSSIAKALGDCPPSYSTQVKPPDLFTVELVLAKNVLTQGEALGMTLKVRNGTLQDYRFAFDPYRPKTDFWITHGGTTIFRESYPEYPNSNCCAVGDGMFKSLKEYSNTLDWTQSVCHTADGSEGLSPLPPGFYQARALHSVGRKSEWWTAPVQFEIR